MIKVILQGGLGNQMFEYAASHALSRKRNVPLSLDLSFFDVYGHKPWCRPYELSVFTLHQSAVYTRDCHVRARLLPRLRRWCRQQGRHSIGRYVFEMSDSQDAPSRDSLVMFDYFANCHLFEEYREDLLQAFTFASSPDIDNLALLNKMEQCNSVAVHIRRGDYLNSANSCVFFHPSVAWYRQAIEEMEKRVKLPVYYFFSDDINWVEKQFNDVKNAVFVDFNHGKEAYNDMRLMSRCKHNIIANSTFSWWGAWLNENPDKVVIAPAKYYIDETQAKKYQSQMIPKGWITIE